jgi:inhibitor of KinA
MKKTNKINFFRLNENSVLIQWPMEVSENTLSEVTALSAAIKINFVGVLCTPTYASILAVFPLEIKDFIGIQKELEILYSKLNLQGFIGKHIEIPVCYDSEFALDAPFVSDSLKINFKEIIKAHTKPSYRIYGIGFLPGFMYLGGLESQLKISRKHSPRMSVPKGSVGIAGIQTGVYPQESPGGWQIIGNCPLEFFKVNEKPPFFAAVGDTISFVSITKDQYKLIKIEEEAGVYKLKTRPHAKVPHTS